MGLVAVSGKQVEALNSHCSDNNYPDLVYLSVKLIAEPHDENDVALLYRNIHYFDSPLFDYNMRSADLMDNFHHHAESAHDRHVENLSKYNVKNIVDIVLNVIFILLEIVHDLLILFLIISDAGKYSFVIESRRGGPLAYSLIHSPEAACNSLQI